MTEDPDAMSETLEQPASGPSKTKPVFSQDPHKTSEPREKVLEVAIGREVRAIRRQHNSENRRNENQIRERSKEKNFPALQPHGGIAANSPIK